MNPIHRGKSIRAPVYCHKETPIPCLQSSSMIFFFLKINIWFSFNFTPQFHLLSYTSEEEVRLITNEVVIFLSGEVIEQKH